MYSSVVGALVALVLATPSTAHTWVEELDVINPQTGLFSGTPGYCRNNTKRTVPGFSDPLMVHILPSEGQPAIEERDTIPALDTTGIYPNDTMCKRSQQSPYQSNGSPSLQAAPGDLVALRYQENGHVTLPQNQPGKQSNRGWVYVYGTTQPKFPELFLDVFGQWNAANGTGGSERGQLLAKQPYDDGYCYQVNDGNISTYRQAQFPHTPNQLMGTNLWCQNNIALPTDIPTGSKYTLYWVWDWPTEPGVDPNLPKGKAELYTTCMDIDIVAKPGSKRRMKVRQAPAPSSPSSIDRNSMAIPAYVSSLTASPAPAGASPSAQGSPASPEATTTSPADVQIAANPTNTANSYIENAVSAAIVAEAPKVPLTVTVDIVISPIAGATAANQAASPVAASTPLIASVSTPALAPAATQAASPAAASTPTTAPAAAPSSLPPKSLDINPPILSATATPVVAPAVATTAGPSASAPGFSGTATPVVASPAVAANAGAAANSTSAVMAVGASQNGTVAAKGQCAATTCKSKRRSILFGKKGGQRL